MPPKQALCAVCAGYGKFWIRVQELDGKGKVVKASVTGTNPCSACDGTGRPPNELINAVPEFAKGVKSAEPRLKLEPVKADEPEDEDYSVGGAL